MLNLEDPLIIQPTNVPVDDLRELTGIDNKTIRRWCKNGALPELPDVVDQSIVARITILNQMEALGIAATNEIARTAAITGCHIAVALGLRHRPGAVMIQAATETDLDILRSSFEPTMVVDKVVMGSNYPGDDLVKRWLYVFADEAAIHFTLAGSLPECFSNREREITPTVVVDLWNVAQQLSGTMALIATKEWQPGNSFGYLYEDRPESVLFPTTRRHAI